jgi:uncharacterized phiE125 gp8 family phage protein
MGLELLTAPYAEPIGLYETKAHCRVQVTADDTYLTDRIRDVREYVEEGLSLQFVAATWRLKLDEFPEDDEILLPRGPVIGISAISYVDSDGATQSLTSSDYQLDTSKKLARLQPAYGEAWPSTREQLNAVTVDFYAGYLAPFTAVAATNVITVQGRTLTNGDKFRLSNHHTESGGALPGGLSANTDYYVISASGSTGKLSLTSGGSEVDITDTGTGTHFLGQLPGRARSLLNVLVANLYENREAVIKGTIVAELPWAAQSLWWSLWPGEM